MQGFTYAVDLVLVIDATGSMSPIIDRVKRSALDFHAALQRDMLSKNKEISQLRLRVVVSRDLYADGEAGLEASDFFLLPQEQEEFARFVDRISARGGGDEPETTLESLALAMKSPWTTEGTRRRQVIVVWTDASCHPLEKSRDIAASHYPPDMPDDFDALTDMWEGQEYMDSRAKRLILYAPDAYAWTDMANNWDMVIHFPSRGGDGLSDVEYDSILDTIAQTI